MPVSWVNLRKLDSYKTLGSESVFAEALYKFPEDDLKKKKNLCIFMSFFFCNFWKSADVVTQINYKEILLQ